MATVHTMDTYHECINIIINSFYRSIRTHKNHSFNALDRRWVIFNLSQICCSSSNCKSHLLLYMLNFGGVAPAVTPVPLRT